MFKNSHRSSTTSRRVRVVRSVATSHADTAASPRPIAPRPTTAVAKPGPSRPRVRPPEQSTEPLPAPPPARSHSQDRVSRMSTTRNSPPPPSTAPAAAAARGGLYVGVDVVKDELDQTPP